MMNGTTSKTSLGGKISRPQFSHDKNTAQANPTRLAVLISSAVDEEPSKVTRPLIANIPISNIKSSDNGGTAKSSAIASSIGCARAKLWKIKPGTTARMVPM